MGTQTSTMATTMVPMKAIARVNVAMQRAPAQQVSMRATHALAPRSFAAFKRSTAVHRTQRLMVKAAEETEVVESKEAPAEEDFEAKLAALKGSRRAGGGAKAAKRVAAQTGKDVALEEAYAPKVNMDFSKEEVIFEGKPAVGDLVTNIALGATLLWLPLTFAAVGRFQWLKYKFSDMRIVMESSAPFESGVTQITYNQIKKVVTIGRGVGLWGDMVITLQNGENVEFRSLEKYKELEAMINEKIGAIEKTQNADPKGF